MSTKKRYTTTEVKDVPIQGPAQAQTVLYPNVIGQYARESTTDYANPRQGEILATDAGGIQRAIDSLYESGGGVVRLPAGTIFLQQNVNLKSNVSLIGMGRDVSILQFSSAAYGINVVGAAFPNRIQNCVLANFTVEASGNTAGITITNCEFFKLNNVLVKDGTGDGFRFTGCYYVEIINCRTVDNGGNGFNFTDLCQVVTMLGCEAANSTLDGFELAAAADSYSFFGGCFANNNTGKGFDVDADFIEINGCSAVGNGDDGYEFSGQDLRVTGCGSYNNTGADYDIQSGSNYLSFTGNSFTPTATTGSSHSRLIIATSGVDGAIIANNSGESPRTRHRSMRMINSSGADRNSGDIVILHSTADGDDVTTTTTAGDDMVFGVVETAGTIANGDPLYVVVEGFVNNLKVNGTTNIAIGDFLCTFTTAGIAAKAGAGDMAIAIALEAYTTDDSNGVIDALIITPRKI